MGFSAFLALTFTPALCASFLKSSHGQNKNWIFRTFEKYYEKLSHRYVRLISNTLKRTPRWTAFCGTRRPLWLFIYTDAFKLPA